MKPAGGSEPSASATEVAKQEALVTGHLKAKAEGLKATQEGKPGETAEAPVAEGAPVGAPAKAEAPATTAQAPAPAEAKAPEPPAAQAQAPTAQAPAPTAQAPAVAVTKPEATKPAAPKVAEKPVAEAPAKPKEKQPKPAEKEAKKAPKAPETPPKRSSEAGKPRKAGDIAHVGKMTASEHADTVKKLEEAKSNAAFAHDRGAVHVKVDAQGQREYTVDPHLGARSVHTTAKDALSKLKEHEGAAPAHEQLAEHTEDFAKHLKGGPDTSEGGQKEFGHAANVFYKHAEALTAQKHLANMSTEDLHKLRASGEASRASFKSILRSGARRGCSWRLYPARRAAQNSEQS